MLRILAALACLAIPAPSFADTVATCPTEVRGVKVAMKQLPDGIGITFTAPRGGQLGPLRLLLREAAVLLEQRTKLAALHPDPDHMPDSTGASAGIPALDISVRDVANGAFVEVRPDEEYQLDMLRAKSARFTYYWDRHECVASTAAVAR